MCCTLLGNRALRECWGLLAPGKKQPSTTQRAHTKALKALLRVSDLLKHPLSCCSIAAGPSPPGEGEISEAQRISPSSSPHLHPLGEMEHLQFSAG